MTSSESPDGSIIALCRPGDQQTSIRTLAFRRRDVPAAIRGEAAAHWFDSDHKAWTFGEIVDYAAEYGYEIRPLHLGEVIP